MVAVAVFWDRALQVIELYLGYDLEMGGNSVIRLEGDLLIALENSFKERK